jgi:signal transduction histidine kinase
VLANQSPDQRRVWIALQVVDTGVGIAPANQARIFEEFEQVNAGPRGESMQRGTGLGLAISRRLAQLLGGDIRVESQVGKGSTFTLWLPVHPADLEPLPESSPGGVETAV